MASSSSTSSSAGAAWADRYPAIVRVWRAHWQEFVPFLAFPPEVRRVIYTTNLIESMNARLRKVTRNRGQFPSEQAALKALPGRLQPRGLPGPQRRSPEFRVEASSASLHDLLRRTNPNPMTAKITYTDGRTLPLGAPARVAVMDHAGRRVLEVRQVVCLDDGDACAVDASSQRHQPAHGGEAPRRPGRRVLGWPNCQQAGAEDRTGGD